MGETPNQQVGHNTGSRQGKCVRGSWRDLIGQMKCGLEALIGWEPHALMSFPGHSIVWSMRHARFILSTMTCVCSLEGSSRYGRHTLNSEIRKL